MLRPCRFPTNIDVVDIHIDATVRCVGQLRPPNLTPHSSRHRKLVTLLPWIDLQRVDQDVYDSTFLIVVVVVPLKMTCASTELNLTSTMNA